jgi:hypothetical protein
MRDIRIGAENDLQLSAGKAPDGVQVGPLSAPERAEALNLQSGGGTVGAPQRGVPAEARHGISKAAHGDLQVQPSKYLKTLEESNVHRGVRVRADNDVGAG